MFQLPKTICSMWSQNPQPHETIVFYSVPAHREDLQYVKPESTTRRNHGILQCSSSQRGIYSGSADASCTRNHCENSCVLTTRAKNPAQGSAQGSRSRKKNLHKECTRNTKEYAQGNFQSTLMIKYSIYTHIYISLSIYIYIYTMYKETIFLSWLWFCQLALKQW